MAISDRQLEAVEIELLQNLAGIRAERQRLAQKAGGNWRHDPDRIAKQAPATVDINGKPYVRHADGSYRPVAAGGPNDGAGARHPAAPVPLVTVSGQGGGRQAAAEEGQAVAVIKALRRIGTIPLRPVH